MMDVAGWRGGTTDLCPGQKKKPSRIHCLVGSIVAKDVHARNHILVIVAGYFAATAAAGWLRSVCKGR